MKDAETQRLKSEEELHRLAEANKKELERLEKVESELAALEQQRQERIEQEKRDSQEAEKQRADEEKRRQQQQQEQQRITEQNQIKHQEQLALIEQKKAELGRTGTKGKIGERKGTTETSTGRTRTAAY